MPQDFLLGDARAFSVEGLKRVARERALLPEEAAGESLPDPLSELSYDQYREIRFRSAYALWKDGGHFSAQFFHRGFYYRDAVRVYAVDQGEAREVFYDAAAFDFGRSSVGPAAFPATLGFAGFRLHTALNTPAYADELIAFLGASYFRAVGRGMRYGLSARGLAIDTASGAGEEYPVFRDFYLEHPADPTTVVVHTLLDSPGATGVYSFSIQPGDATVMHVEATLYPRRDLTHFGLAPLTSMFLFAPQDRDGVDDFRNAVHDSDGLLLLTGGGEWLWRPLVNPRRLRVSSFQDNNPQGFGLMQRDREFNDYQDLEARYETRPSAWVEPVGDWGAGAVTLVEIPTDRETNDNIVAFWQPREPLVVGREFRFAYRLSWCTHVPRPAGPSARAVATRVGRGGNAADDDGRALRKFTIDFAGPELPRAPDAGITAVVSGSTGAIRDTVSLYNDVTGGWRVYFDLEPGDAELVELRCFLKRGDDAQSETWTFQWTP